MTRRWFAVFAIGVLLAGGCDALAADWPDRQGRTPDQMLTDLVQCQQRKYVRASTGELADECFTDRDFAVFKSSNTPRQLVARLKLAPDFKVVVSALRTFQPEKRAATLQITRQSARPTWQSMGYIDRQGRGQTAAGHQADLLIAEAIVDAFAGALAAR